MPLRENTVGAGAAPVSVPLKPTDAEPPAAMVRFQSALATVTCWPVWLQVPFQPDCTASPASGHANVRLHPFTAVAPRLVTVMLPPKPPGQLLVTS